MVVVIAPQMKKQKALARTPVEPLEQIAMGLAHLMQVQIVMSDLGKQVARMIGKTRDNLQWTGLPELSMLVIVINKFTFD